MPEIAGLFAYRTISRKIDLGPRWSIAGYARWLLEPYGRPSRLEADTEVLDAYRFTDAALAAGRKMGWRGKFSAMPQLFATSGQLGLIWREGNVSYVVSQTELPRLDAAPSIHDFASTCSTTLTLITSPI